MNGELDQIPRRGNKVVQALAKGMYRLIGWRIVGEMPNLPKFLIIGAPHTSNWDFMLAMNFIFATRMRIDWMAKHTVFQSPLAPLFRWLGGFPVDRGAASGVVQQVADEAARRERFVLALAPEGTRRKVAKWRTGWYYIAHGVGMPIVPVTIDYGRKQIGIRSPFYPTGDIAADLPLLQAQFADVTGKNRDQF